MMQKAVPIIKFKFKDDPSSIIVMEANTMDQLLQRMCQSLSLHAVLLCHILVHQGMLQPCDTVMLAISGEEGSAMDQRQMFFVTSSSFLPSATQQHGAASIESGWMKQQEEIQNDNQPAMTVVWHHHWWYHDTVQ